MDTFSKEGIYFLLNFFFAVLAAVVLFGTFYPVISKAFIGTTVVLRIGFFNTMTVPLFLGLVLLMGVAPAMAWRSDRGRAVVQRLKWPWIVSIMGGVAAYLWGAKTLPLLVGDMVALFAFASMIQEFAKAARIRRMAMGERWPVALVRAVRNDRRRFGGYIAHLAFLIVVLGVIGSHTGNYTVSEVFRQGQTQMVGPYHVTFTGLNESTHPNYQVTQANIVINGDGYHNRAVAPGIEFFAGSSQPVAQVTILGGWWQDLYAVMEGYAPGGTRVTLQFFVNPMVSWIWIGMYILVAGTLIAMSGPRRLRPQRASAKTEMGYNPAPLRERRDEA